ncbi:hypothetical protein NT05LI_2120a, partial [Listeria ivanovii FSL F6-596]
FIFFIIHCIKIIINPIKMTITINPNIFFIVLDNANFSSIFTIPTIIAIPINTYIYFFLSIDLNLPLKEKGFCSLYSSQ